MNTEPTRWRATVRHALAAPLDDETQTKIVRALPGYGILTTDGQNARMEMTVEADDLPSAAQAALAVTADLIRSPAAQLSVQSEDDHLATPASVPALVGVREIAEIMGASSRQRAHQITQKDDFPAPVQELATGPVWSREVIEYYRDNVYQLGRPGRKPKSES